MKLSDINPVELARESVIRLIDSMTDRFNYLSPMINVTIGDICDSDLTAASCDIVALYDYARAGDIVAWRNHMRAYDVAIKIRAMFGVRLDSELDIVTAAAIGRAKIKTETLGPLTAREIAAMAGVTYFHVTRLMQSWTIVCANKSRDRTASPAEARRWLISRGVPGM